MRKLKLEELNRISVEDFKKKKKTPICIVLDNVRSALNVGSIFRTSDAFAIEKIYLVGITARPPHKEINKTAIGATASVDWEYNDNIVEVIKDLKSNDYTILGIEQTDTSVFLNEYKSNESKIALIFGNEVNGLSEEVLPLLDQSVEIPQIGTKHSLNVSVCAGICIWHFYGLSQSAKNG